MEDLDISEQNGYEIKAYYKDENGHQANVGFNNKIDIAPTIFLPDEIKSLETHHFDYEKIKKCSEIVVTSDDNLTFDFNSVSVRFFAWICSDSIYGACS
mgnify:CR=1 FL=1